MGRWTSIPVAGGAYSDESRPWAHQDCVNLLVENAERPGTRSVAKLRAVPGMAMLSDLGTNAPIRGMRNVEGLLVVVSGNRLFTIDVNGAVTDVGNIPGVLRTKMTHNQIAGGNQVVIPADGLGYVYNTHTGTLAQITDDGFLGATTFDYIYSYVVGVEPRGRFAFTSDLADATSYNTLDRVEAESSPDLIVGHIVNHEEWWLCGQTTIEPFVNDGSATGTFKRQGGTVIQRGVASAHCMSLLDNAVFLVGDDGCVYRFDGYTPVRISTMPIEQALSECNLALCFSFTFEDQGHKVYYVTCPDGYTWGYDVATKEWHRRASKGLKRWRINDLVRWNGRWVGGDFSNGKLYQLDWNLASDVGDELVRERSMGVIHDNQNGVIINGLELVIDTGRGVNSPPLPAVIPRQKLSLSGAYASVPGGEDYSSDLSIIGGNFKYRNPQFVSGMPPTGLSLTVVGSSLRLSGNTSSPAGNYTFTVSVDSEDGQTATSAQTVTVVVGYAETVLADGPLGYWKLDDAAGSPMIDSSGNGHDGEYLVNGVVNRVGGIRAGAVGAMRLTAFTGGARIPNPSSFFEPANNPMSLEIIGEWIESGVSFGDALNDGSQGLDGNCRYRLIYRYGTSNSIPRVDFGSSGMASAGAPTSGPAHLLFTYKPPTTPSGTDGVAKFYVDGVLVSTNSTAPNNPTGGGDAHLRLGGGYSEFPDSYGLKATLSDLAIYDKELTAEQALAHAVAGGFA